MRNSEQGMLFECSPDGLVRPAVAAVTAPAPARVGGAATSTGTSTADPAVAHRTASPKPQAASLPSATSRRALIRARMHAESTSRRIFEAICDAGPRGKTCEELEDALGLPHQTVSARISEMRNKGWLDDPKNVRSTRRKGLAAVYTAPEERTTN